MILTTIPFRNVEVLIERGKQEICGHLVNFRPKMNTTMLSYS